MSYDDDGGRGTPSLLTFAATTSGTFYMTTGTFDNGDVADNGNHTIDI